MSRPTRPIAPLVALAVIAAMAGPAGGQSPSAAPDLPPPPSWFVPSMVRYAGDLSGYPRGDGSVVQLGAIDGSDLQPVAIDGADQVQLAADGRLVVSTDLHSGRALVVRDPDGTLRTLLVPSGAWTLDADGDEVYAFGVTAVRA